MRGRLNFFVARGQMDIEGLGPETIEVLLKNGLVRDIQDIYTFDPGRLLELPGFGEKKVAAIREGIAKSREQPFRIVFQSLGIPDIGQKVTELLIDAGYADMTALLALADGGDPAPLLAHSRHRGADRGDPDPRAVRSRHPGQDRGAAGSGAAHARGEGGARRCRGRPYFAGQTWCVTGSFRTFTPGRRRWRRCHRRGGRVSASVTAKTTHLLVGENPGSKLQKAVTTGAKVVTEDEFLALLQNNT